MNEELGLKFWQIHWFLDRESELLKHNKLLLYKLVLKLVGATSWCGSISFNSEDTQRKAISESY